MGDPIVTAVRGVDLNVRNLDESIRFYCDSWGLQEAGRDGNGDGENAFEHVRQLWANTGLCKWVPPSKSPTS